MVGFYVVKQGGVGLLDGCVQMRICGGVRRAVGEWLGWCEVTWRDATRRWTEQKNETRKCMRGGRGGHPSAPAAAAARVVGTG